jgi:hypothetical protein
MQRLACLSLVLFAACGGGTATGEATLTGTMPPVKASAAETFVGATAGGNKVMGWTILLYENEAGGDCLEGTVAAKVNIFTTTAEGSAPQALLNNGDSISIVTESPPTIAGTAAANMGVENVSNVVGLLQITDFRRSADNMHAEYIQGTISAGGYGPNDESVSLTGMFDAPICTEE